jgi:hypothetical protein
MGLTAEVQDMLYIVLVAAGRIITLVRPKKHSIHPSGIPSSLPLGQTQLIFYGARSPHLAEHHPRTIHLQQLCVCIMAPYLPAEVQFNGVCQHIRELCTARRRFDLSATNICHRGRHDE